MSYVSAVFAIFWLFHCRAEELADGRSYARSTTVSTERARAHQGAGVDGHALPTVCAPPSRKGPGLRGEEASLFETCLRLVDERRRGSLHASWPRKVLVVLDDPGEYAATSSMVNARHGDRTAPR